MRWLTELSLRLQQPVFSSRSRTMLSSPWRLLLAFAVCLIRESAAEEPANSKSNQKARALLRYFNSLESRGDKRLISGQFVDFGRGTNLKLIEAVHEKTDQWPALIGVDYADFGTGGLTFAAPNQTALEYW